MSMNLTQPEEIDLILKSMEWQERKLPLPPAPQRPAARRQEGGGGFVSAYRAAYLNSHRSFKQQ